MVEYLNHLFNEESIKIIDEFINSEYHCHKFLNIDMSRNIEQYDLIVESMKQKYGENSYFFTEEELDEFESAKKRFIEFFQNNDINWETDETLIEELEQIRNTESKYEEIIYFNELIFLPKIMSDLSALKKYSSSDTLSWREDGTRYLRKSRIIVLNKIPFEELYLPRNFCMRMNNLTCHSKNEYYESIHSNIQNYRMNLLDKFWNPTNMLK